MTHDSVVLPDGTGEDRTVATGLSTEDGSEALPLGPVAGGTDITGAHIFWDGYELVAIYSSLVDATAQIHMAPVSCK